MILNHQLVRSYTHVEGVVLTPPMPLNLSFLLRTEICEYLEGGAPFFEFHLPIDNNGGGYDDQVRAPDSAVACQAGKHRYGLYGLSEAHLIGQDPVEFLVVQGD